MISLNYFKVISENTEYVWQSIVKLIFINIL